MKNIAEKILDKPLILKLSRNILIAIPSILIIYHALVVTGVITPDHVWIGQIDNKQKLYSLEILAITLNLLLVFTGIKSRDLRRLNKAFHIFLSLLSWYMVGNTVANLFAESLIEKVLFTPLMIFLTCSVWVIKLKARPVLDLK